MKPLMHVNVYCRRKDEWRFVIKDYYGGTMFEGSARTKSEAQKAATAKKRELREAA